MVPAEVPGGRPGTKGLSQVEGMMAFLLQVKASALEGTALGIGLHMSSGTVDQHHVAVGATRN